MFCIKFKIQTYKRFVTANLLFCFLSNQHKKFKKILLTLKEKIYILMIKKLNVFYYEKKLNNSFLFTFFKKKTLTRKLLN